MNIPRLNVSLMAAAMVFLSGTFLFYTAVIAPAQIFLWESDETECKFFPTLYFDLCVDTFFMIEICLQFCTGILDISETYCDNFKVIGARYLASPSGFLFDLFTSIPWSFNDLYNQRVKHRLATHSTLIRHNDLLYSLREKKCTCGHTLARGVTESFRKNLRRSFTTLVDIWLDVLLI